MPTTEHLPPTWAAAVHIFCAALENNRANKAKHAKHLANMRSEMLRLADIADQPSDALTAYREGMRDAWQAVASAINKTGDDYGLQISNVQSPASDAHDPVFDGRKAVLKKSIPCLVITVHPSNPDPVGALQGLHTDLTETHCTDLADGSLIVELVTKK